MNPYIQLAKQAVEKYIKERKIIEPPANLPENFYAKKSGAFVTIENHSFGSAQDKKLRGCIGTYLATRPNIAEEIIHNAVAAASEDYRFNPIAEKELKDLSYTVYILHEPEPVKDTKELDPKKYGVIVKTAPIIYPDNANVIFNGHLSYKSGLLLPDLEGINTPEEQIYIACQKGEINPTKEKIIIYKFSVEKYQ